MENESRWLTYNIALDSEGYEIEGWLGELLGLAGEHDVKRSISEIDR